MTREQSPITPTKPAQPQLLKARSQRRYITRAERKQMRQVRKLALEIGRQQRLEMERPSPSKQMIEEDMPESESDEDDENYDGESEDGSTPGYEEASDESDEVSVKQDTTSSEQTISFHDTWRDLQSKWLGKVPAHQLDDDSMQRLITAIFSDPEDVPTNILYFGARDLRLLVLIVKQYPDVHCFALTSNDYTCKNCTDLLSSAVEGNLLSRRQANRISISTRKLTHIRDVAEISHNIDFAIFNWNQMTYLMQDFFMSLVVPDIEDGMKFNVALLMDKKWSGNECFGEHMMSWTCSKMHELELDTADKLKKYAYISSRCEPSEWLC